MKTHKRVIAAFVAFAFLTLLQVTAMPLRADQAPDRSGAAVASPDQGPSYIEEEGTSGSGGKKSILPVILIGLGVAALAAVLVLVVFKTKYDIVGVWNIDFSATNTTKNWTWTVTFSGSKESGDWIDAFGETGTYTVDGKNVSWRFDDFNIVCTGTFSGKDKISGNATLTGVYIGGISVTGANWTATRNASGTGSGALPQSAPTARVSN